MNKTPLYCISGLGADERVFRLLKFPPHVEVFHVKWLQPEINESLSSYAARLATQINTTQPFYLLGLSFGGIMAVELNHHLKPVKTILISSVTNRAEFSWYFKLIARLKLYEVFPYQRLTWFQRIVAYFMGTQPKGSLNLLKDYLQQTNSEYLRWSIRQILCWQQRERIPNIVHIHGTRDKIFSSSHIKADYWIEEGSHMMVYDKAADISRCLQTILNPVDL